MTANPDGPAPQTAAFRHIQKLARAQAGIVIPANRQYLVESRLAPLLQAENLGSITALVARLRAGADRDLERRVVEALAIDETYFFRDSRPFLALEETIIPELMQSRSSLRSLHFWSAAASSGQEIYSIALLLRERFPQLSSWNLKLVASDISTHSLARARRGEFSDLDVHRGLSPPMLAKYFERTGDGWTIRDEIRHMVDFRRLNLIEPWPAVPAMDVVFLRNVLIYFEDETRRSILERLAAVLRPGGFLFLGNAESIPAQVSRAFTRVQLGGIQCYRV
jgi:chemotaxis protein methyltransferase CheR